MSSRDARALGLLLVVLLFAVAAETRGDARASLSSDVRVRLGPPTPTPPPDRDGPRRPRRASSAVDPLMYSPSTRRALDRRFARVDAAVLVMDFDGRLVYGREAGSRRPIASVTKLLVGSAASERWGDGIAAGLSATLLPSDNARSEALTARIGGGSWSTGVETVERRTRALGSSARLSDGSGLSPANRDSPYGLVRFLLRARRAPGFSTLLRSLPVSGVSGTLRGRLAGLEGACSAKTGTLPSRGVSTLAGYCGGIRPVAFAILTRGQSVSLSHRMQDEALWLLLHRMRVSA